MTRARGLFVATLVLAIAACNQILGTPDPVACRVGLALPDGACSSCVAEKCCAEASACAAHPSCNGYETCALGCGSDYACRTACLSQQPITTNDDLPALDHCVATNCGAPCGLSCGVPVSPQQPDVAQACLDCVSKRACDPAQACGASYDCAEFIWCVLGCFTNDCQHACEVAHPQGLDEFAALYSTLGSQCPVCDSNGYWQCVDVPTERPIVVEAVPKVLGLGRTSSSVKAFTRAGTISFVQAFPTPLP